jgi:hypothetical protein
MEFSLAEKLALIRAIEDVIEADGQVNLKEVEIMKQLSYFLNFDMSIVEEARKLSRAESLLLLRGMARNKKKSLGLILKAHEDNYFLSLVEGFIYLFANSQDLNRIENRC